MDEFVYLEAEKFNISSDLKAPLVAKEPKVDVSNKIHGIQLGDKCVPASRFKLKTRQTLKNMQGVANYIEMNDSHTVERIEWSNQIYTFKDVRRLLVEEKYLLAKLETGFSTEKFELARSQILLINGYGFEKRASVVHENGCTISFPLDFPVQITHAGKSYQRFEQLIKATRLPARIELKSQNPIQPSYVQICTVSAVKEYIYVKACTVEHGWVDQSELLILPELSQIEFKIGVGLLNTNSKVWSDYKNMLQRSIRHLQSQLAKCYSNILFESEITSISVANDNSNSTHHYSKSLQDFFGTYQDLPYINIGNSESTNEHNNNNNAKNNDINFNYDIDEDNGEKTSDSRTAGIVDTNIGTIQNDTYDEIKDQYSSTEQQATGNPVTEIQQPRPKPRPTGDPVKNCVAETSRLPQLLTLPNGTEKKDFPAKNAPLLVVNGSGNPRRHPMAVPQPVVVKQPVAGPPSTVRIASPLIKKIEPVAEKFEPFNKLPVKEKPKPLVNGNSGGISNGKSPATVAANGEEKEIKEVEDIPSDLTKLSTNQVSACFLLLGLHRYREQVQRLKIDGKALCDFDEKYLTGTLAMTPFEASKVTRFLRGWRP